MSDQPKALCSKGADQSSTDVCELLPKDWNWTYDSQGPVCGVYAVCRALSQLGIEVLPTDLWSSTVVGQSQGSTPGELMKAIRKFGCQADLRQHLNLLDLQAAGLPVIANVRSASDRTAYDHWVCVQAAEQGLFLFDGSAPGRVINPAEFLAGFSGVGIVVGPNSAGRLRIDAAKSVSIVTLLAVGLFALSVLYSPFLLATLMICLGLCLVTKQCVEMGRTIALAVLLLFTAAQLVSWLSGKQIGCGCFGFSDQPISLLSISIPAGCALICISNIVLNRGAAGTERGASDEPIYQV